MTTVRTQSNPFASHRPWRPLAVACVLACGLLVSACTVQDGDVLPDPDMGNGPSEQPTATALDPSSTLPATPSASDVASLAGAKSTRDAELAALAGADAVTVVEDWAEFESADAVESTIARNLGVGENSMTLSLGAAEASTLPDDGLVYTYVIPNGVLVLTYEILASAPHDFVGFNRDLDPPADWTGASDLALWIDATMDADVNVVFQFREISGEVWRHQGPMPTSADGSPLVVPIDAEAFAWASWSTTENGTPDLGAIDQYGVYVGHSGPGRAGVVHFGPIALIR